MSDRPLGFGMGKAIALSDKKGDRPLGFDMGKAIALSDKKGDRRLVLNCEVLGQGRSHFRTIRAIAL